MSVYSSIVVAPTTPVEARAHGDESRLAVVQFGSSEGGCLVVQGGPEVMVALFDRARTDLVAAIAKAWPVEDAHAAEKVAVSHDDKQVTAPPTALPTGRNHQ